MEESVCQIGVHETAGRKTPTHNSQLQLTRASTKKNGCSVALLGILTRHHLRSDPAFAALLCPVCFRQIPSKFSPFPQPSIIFPKPSAINRDLRRQLDGSYPSSPPPFESSDRNRRYIAVHWSLPRLHWPIIIAKKQKQQP